MYTYMLLHILYNYTFSHHLNTQISLYMHAHLHIITYTYKSPFCLINSFSNFPGQHAISLFSLIHSVKAFYIRMHNKLHPKFCIHTHINPHTHDLNFIYTYSITHHKILHTFPFHFSYILLHFSHENGFPFHFYQCRKFCTHSFFIPFTNTHIYTSYFHAKI